jgi:hypothetical protein
MCVPDGGRAEGRPQNLPLISPKLWGGKKTCMKTIWGHNSDKWGRAPRRVRGAKLAACMTTTSCMHAWPAQSRHTVGGGMVSAHTVGGGMVSAHTALQSNAHTQHTSHPGHSFGMCVLRSCRARLRLSTVIFATHTINAFSWRQAPRGPHQLGRRAHTHPWWSGEVDLWIISVNFKNVIEKSTV